MNGIFTPRSGTSFVGALTRRRRKDSSSSQGSAAPSADIARHSGAGRFARARMSTMTFAETGHSSRTLSLSDIVAGRKFSAGKATLRLREILERLAYGGWPGFLDEMTPTLLEGFRDYLSSLVEVELATGIGTGREPVRVRRLLVALARGVSTEISISPCLRCGTDMRDSVLIPRRPHPGLRD